MFPASYLLTLLPIAAQKLLDQGQAGAVLSLEDPPAPPHVHQLQVQHSKVQYNTVQYSTVQYPMSTTSRRRRSLSTTGFHPDRAPALLEELDEINVMEEADLDKPRGKLLSKSHTLNY